MNGGPQVLLMEPRDRLTAVELDRVLLCVRRCRLDVSYHKMALEEKHRTHGDGHVAEAILHMDNDLALLTSAMVKLDTIVRSSQG
jgi:hypothetical protein